MGYMRPDLKMKNKEEEEPLLPAIQRGYFLVYSQRNIQS